VNIEKPKVRPGMYYTTNGVDHTMELDGCSSSVHKITNSILYIKLILEL
jgi:hypothetical protein